MDNSLLHIGLHVLEDDVKNFYIEILNGEPVRSFNIQAEDALEIFGIYKEAAVQLFSCGGIDLELFVDGKIDYQSFGHVCFKSGNAKEIYRKAEEKGYKTLLRKRNSYETYFISDRNNNVFEIKNL